MCKYNKKVIFLACSIIIGHFCVVKTSAGVLNTVKNVFNIHKITLEIISETSRDVEFYFFKKGQLPKVGNLPEVNLFKLQQTSETGKQMLFPTTTKFMEVANKEVYAVVIRKGETTLGRDLSTELTACGPLHNGDKLIIATKKRFGFDKGTMCKIVKHAN